MSRRVQLALDPRVWSNRELRCIRELVPPGVSVLNVSGYRDSDKEGSSYADYWRDPVEYRVSNYSGDSTRGLVSTKDIELDLMSDVPPELLRRFDVVLSHTVLEHLEDPQRAFERLASIASEWLVTIVPFRQVLHYSPGDYGDFYRFTPFSMRRYYWEAGFKVVYESFTPPPAMTVYLAYLGVREDSPMASSFAEVGEIDALRNEVGRITLRDAMKYVALRMYDRASSRLGGER